MFSPFIQVTCRTVGIGSYLTRLGQRIVQVENSNIILTGFHALNKVRVEYVFLLILGQKLFAGRKFRDRQKMANFFYLLKN